MPERAGLPPIVHSVRASSVTYLAENALADLYDAVRTLENRGIGGILIEAGCALGGSAIVIASAKAPARPLCVYDVFGMIPSPSAQDGPDVHERYRVIQSGHSTGIGGNTYYGYIEDLQAQVAENFRRLGVDPDANNVRLVKGLFADTLRIDEPVALAHLDGDWYDSVMTCLQRIEPKLLPTGVIIIDDYDDWSGCRKAVDEYFEDKRDRYDFMRKSRLHIVRR
jgi:O-methyltransferase